MQAVREHASGQGARVVPSCSPRRPRPNPSLKRDCHRQGTWPARLSLSSSASRAKRLPGVSPLAQTLGRIRARPCPPTPLLGHPRRSWSLVTLRRSHGFSQPSSSLTVFNEPRRPSTHGQGLSSSSSFTSTSSRLSRPSESTSAFAFERTVFRQHTLTGQPPTKSRIQRTRTVGVIASGLTQSPQASKLVRRNSFSAFWRRARIGSDLWNPLRFFYRQRHRSRHRLARRYSAKWTAWSVGKLQKLLNRP